MGISTSGSPVGITRSYVVHPGEHVAGAEEPQSAHGVVITDGDVLHCVDGALSDLAGWARRMYLEVLRADNQHQLADRLAALTHPEPPVTFAGEAFRHWCTEPSAWLRTNGKVHVLAGSYDSGNSEDSAAARTGRVLFALHDVPQVLRTGPGVGPVTIWCTSRPRHYLVYHRRRRPPGR
ncbi:hypothetical protein [Krasilnikovia sp. MM14-A1259]|uniref:hypothetical protein n=1 Tax=Krasilnikovia sp. MM14-A1259 TaxID=3373539 RepID=UPI00382352CE